MNRPPQLRNLAHPSKLNVKTRGGRNGLAVQVLALAGNIVLCTWARHNTAFFLSTQKYSTRHSRKLLKQPSLAQDRFHIDTFGL